MEAFDITVFPWAAGLDVEGFDFLFRQPVLNAAGDKSLSESLSVGRNLSTKRND